MQINIIEDFDRLVTIEIHGYPSVEDFHHDASNEYRLPFIRTPLIAINSRDDPFIPAASKSSKVALIISLLHELQSFGAVPLLCQFLLIAMDWVSA